MSPSATLALRALIRPATLPGWREYSVVVAGDDVFKGLASTYRCYDLAWRQADPQEPGESALIEVSLWPEVNPDAPDYACVSIQDDMEIARIWVHRSQLVLKPQESLDEMLARRVGAR